MNLAEIVKRIKEKLPVDLIADQDNAGLVVGDYDDECEKMTVAYELSAGVVEESIKSGSNLIVTYHTPLYRSTKSFTSSKSKRDPLFLAMRSGINVFAVHTALDVSRDGLNFDLARRLGLRKIRVLSPLSGTLNKIAVFVPQGSVEKVRAAMSGSGAGVIGNYSECSFASEGEGSFIPGEGSAPFVGTPGKLERTREVRLEMIVEKAATRRVITAMLEAHPYEEVAYDVYSLGNDSVNYGFGAVGEFESPMKADTFLDRVKEVLGIPTVKLSHVPESPLSKVAVCAGSGMHFYSDAVREGADLYVTGDVKHHDFREARLSHTAIADATHAGTERYAAGLLQGIMRKIFQDKVQVNLSKHEFDSAVIY